MTKSIRAIITGATGMAGAGVLQACLDEPAVGKITAVVRRPLEKKHAKLTTIVLDDFLEWTKISSSLEGHNACFWCLGVSQSDVNRKEYRRITYDITMAAAKVIEVVDPGMTFCFLTGMGTKDGSMFMWARVKSEATKDLRKLDLKVYEFRPGLVHPVPGMKNRYLIGRLFYPLIKNSKTMSVKAEDFGMAMINAVLFGYEKVTLENADIKELAQRKGPPQKK